MANENAITKIQLKTKTSENSGDTALDKIDLDLGEVLVDPKATEKKVIIGGTAHNSTANNKANNDSNIILGASKNELAIDSNGKLKLVHKDSNLARSTHYLQLPDGNVTYDSSSATATLETAHSLAVDGSKVELKSADGTSQSSVTLDTHNYTPQGTVSTPTFTGNPANHTHTFTGPNHTHTFTGSEVISGASDTTNNQVINVVTSVGTLPSASLNEGTLPSATFNAGSHSFSAGSLPLLSALWTNQCLTLTFSAGTLPSHSYSAPTHSFSAGSFPSLTFSAGTLPKTEEVTMPTMNHTHSVTANGNIGYTDEDGETDEATITPAGTISQPTFTGTEANITHTFNSNPEV